MNHPVVNILDGHRLQTNRCLRRRQLIWFVLVVSSALLSLAILDYTYILSVAGRYVALSGLVVLLTCLFGYLIVSRRTTSRKELAKDIELTSRITTLAVTTSADERVRDALSAEVEYGDRLQKSLDDAALEVVRGSKLPRPVRLAPWSIGTLAIIALSVAFGMGYGMTSFARVLVPWMALPYTQISLQGPTERVELGKTFQLSGQLNGRIPGSAWLHSTTDPENPLMVELESNGSYSIELTAHKNGSSYWLTSGDGVSREVTVEVFTSAEIASYKIDVQPPAYAARLAKTVEKPDFQVLRGSSIEYKLSVTEPVEGVEFLRINEGPNLSVESIPFEQTSEDGTNYRLNLDPLPGLTQYRLAVKLLSGETSVNDEPWRILALPDAPPRLTITGHNGKKVLKQGDEDVSVKVKATDDVGLETMKLFYRKVGTSGQTQSVPIEGDRPAEFTIDSLLAMAPLELKPRDLVLIFAEGKDGNVLDGPGLGTSQVVMIEVPEPPAEPQERGKRGGGGGGKAQVINPLELQKSILRDTSKLAETPESAAYRELANVQKQINGFVETMLENVRDKIDTHPRAAPLAAQLQLALSAMKLSKRRLDANVKRPSMLAEEFAVSALTRAADMMGGET